MGTGKWPSSGNIFVIISLIGLIFSPVLLNNSLSGKSEENQIFHEERVFVISNIDSRDFLDMSLDCEYCFVFTQNHNEWKISESGELSSDETRELLNSNLVVTIEHSQKNSEILKLNNLYSFRELFTELFEENEIKISIFENLGESYDSVFQNSNTSGFQIGVSKYIPLAITNSSICQIILNGTAIKCWSEILGVELIHPVGGLTSQLIAYNDEICYLIDNFAIECGIFVTNGQNWEFSPTRAIESPSGGLIHSFLVNGQFSCIKYISEYVECHYKNRNSENKSYSFATASEILSFSMNETHMCIISVDLGFGCNDLNESVGNGYIESFSRYVSKDLAFVSILNSELFLNQYLFQFYLQTHF